jgi:peptide deformylase
MKSISELSIVNYPHPALRYAAKPLKRVDARLSEIVRRMFDLMYEHRGVGLAAIQVNIPLQLFIMNPSGQEGEGTETVMINPVISRPRGTDIAEEGCLSLPGIHGDVPRAVTVRVNAYSLDGKEIDRDFTDYEARIIQHETDHLHGRLFVDRLKERDAAQIEEELELLSAEFYSRQRDGSIGDERSLLAELAGWEQAYC